MNTFELPERGYVFSAPAAIYFKKRGEKKYQSSVLCRAKAFLGFNSAGKLQVSFVGNTFEQDIKIVVSKWNLLQLILYHLSLRPIKKSSKQTEIWEGRAILKRNGILPVDLEGKDLDGIKEEYQRVKTLLEEFLPEANKNDQEIAQAQFLKLLEAQYKISVLTEIERTRKLLETLNPQKEARKKETMDKNLQIINESESSKYLHRLSGTWNQKTKK
jgi:hypothetical protein